MKNCQKNSSKTLGRYFRGRPIRGLCESESSITVRDHLSPDMSNTDKAKPSLQCSDFLRVEKLSGDYGCYIKPQLNLI